MLYNIVMILIFIVCVLIILIVLIQNAKGGGLAANFAGSSQIMGVRRTADFLEKSTWTLAISLFVLCIIASMSIPRETVDPNKSKIEDKIMNMPGKNEAPILPNTQPPLNNQQ